MPHGIHNVYIYEVFNTASWSVVLSAPMLLFFQHLNATATVMAIAASLSPILNILQIPAARFVEQVGYRRFVLSGWTMRSMVVVVMAGIAFLPDSFDRPTRMILMLFLLLVYNTLRGISVCGMLPWFTHIVPEERRGEFLAKDQLAGSLAAITALFINSRLLALHDAWYAFGIVFSISAICAFTSLTFLRRVPDVPVEKIVANEQPLPWKEMLFYPPFFRYMRCNIVINVAQGISTAFWVRYFRTFLHISNADVLLFACATNLVLASGLFLISPMIDRVGNKQVLTLSTILLACHYVGWALIAAGIVPCRLPMLILQACTSGFGTALWNLSNMRAVMGIIPAMGRPHFLALYSVGSNLTLGLMPLLWGPIMDALGNWQTAWGHWRWNGYSLLYCLLAAIMVAGTLALQTLAESKTMTWDEFMRELLIKTPSRAVSRLIGRSRGPNF